MDAEPIMLVSFTGNNLEFKNDITARILKCRIDAGMESPEKRRFNWDPVIYAMEHRAELVQAVLMILRAYIVRRRRWRTGRMHPVWRLRRLVSLCARAADLARRAGPCRDEQGHQKRRSRKRKEAGRLQSDFLSVVR